MLAKTAVCVTRLTRVRWLLAILFVATAVWHWGNAAQILLKAQLAQILVERAWNKTLAGAGEVLPWPWADTHPVGRLQWLDNNKQVQRDLLVLAGAQGHSLAFGPGLMDGLNSTLPTARVVGGHRDTHFAFLRELEIGSKLLWQDAHGHWHNYEVTRAHIAHSERDTLWINPDSDSLWLITCYPFEALTAGGPLRYVVQADRVPDEQIVRDAAGEIAEGAIALSGQ